MWTIEPEQIWKKPRKPGISGFMRLKNEAEFLDRAIESHIDALDELVLVFNECSDETPEICARWAKKAPDKVRVFNYEPHVVSYGSPESLTIDPRSPNSFANHSNFAVAKTGRQIVIRIDGDHLAVNPRFARVRTRLLRDERYPIYGINLALFHDQAATYNFYDYATEFPPDLALKPGPLPFTSGEHAFHYIDPRCAFVVEPREGLEMMPLSHTRRSPIAPMSYCFFHLKGLKADRGTRDWSRGGLTGTSRRSLWASNVLALSEEHVASIDMMRRHNPMYFRGTKIYRELRQAFPDMPIWTPRERLPRLSLRERAADAWYHVAMP